MRILLTGASSFTGLWFACELSGAGHDVTAIFRSPASAYDGLRGDRVRMLNGKVERIWDVEFGDDRFLELVRSRPFDLLAHHAAEMADYRSWDFDPIAATATNTRSARRTLTAMGDHGCGKLVLTGSVFEPYEGVGDPTQRAFNPYGLSKHLTFEVFRMEATRAGWSLGKFVIPNPFGPWEELRFTSYLAREWAAGRTPSVATPVYVRDNIHVSLLALAYRRFCEGLGHSGQSRSAPSGYVESQGAFARRLAREIGSRTGRNLGILEADQSEFPEPLFRTNANPDWRAFAEWSETAAWNELAAYYVAAFPVQ